MSWFDFKNKGECLCLFVGQVKTSKKITIHSKTYGAPELIGRLGRALAQGHNYPVGIWKMVVPLSYNGATENCHNPKNGPLKKVPPEVCTAVSRVHGVVMQLYILSFICSLSQYSKDITKEIWSPAMVRSCRSSRWGELHGQPILLSSPRCCWAFLSLWRRIWS